MTSAFYQPFPLQFISAGIIGQTESPLLATVVGHLSATVKHHLQVWPVTQLMKKMHKNQESRLGDLKIETGPTG